MDSRDSVRNTYTLELRRSLSQVDDDTYVIVENLRYFLSGENTSEPIYFGHHFKAIVKQGFYSGGGGYVLSKEALRRFGEKGMTCVCVCVCVCIRVFSHRPAKPSAAPLP